MSEEQVQQEKDQTRPGDVDGENPVADPCTLCRFAMVFIWDVSKEIEKEVANIGKPGNDDKLSKKIIRQMARDIRQQVKDNCPKGEGPELKHDYPPYPVCSLCLQHYNTNMAIPGQTPAHCMQKYSDCTKNCR